MSQLGRISGGLLNDVLNRDGVDLSFETNLLYLDVTNGKIGINQPGGVPSFDLDILGYTKTTDLEVVNQATIDNVAQGVQVGQTIRGLGIPTNTTITAISNTTITLSNPCNLTQIGAGYLSGGFFPIRILYNLNFRPSSVIISNITDLQGNPTFISSGVTPQWRLEEKEVVIDGISGLQAGKNYNITFLIM